MNRYVVFAGILAFACGVPAGGQEMEVRQLAYEVPHEYFRMPATASGDLSLRECEDCDPRRLRVTAQTLYVFDNNALPLREFRGAYIRAVKSDAPPVIVLHDLASDRVVSVTVHTEWQ